jgi:hypothetical protein
MRPPGGSRSTNNLRTSFLRASSAAFLDRPARLAIPAILFDGWLRFYFILNYSADPVPAGGLKWTRSGNT